MDLSECRIQNLSASIGELVQLRYLNAQKIRSQMIPDCITKLSKLIYLNLHGSRISALLVSIGEMKCLMHLDILNCTWITELLESFVNLQRLVNLNFSAYRWLQGVSKALAGLTNIQYLNLSFVRDVEGLPEVIGNLIELRYLDLSCTLNSFCKTRFFNWYLFALILLLELWFLLCALVKQGGEFSLLLWCLTMHLIRGSWEIFSRGSFAHLSLLVVLSLLPLSRGTSTFESLLMVFSCHPHLLWYPSFASSVELILLLLLEG